MGVLLQGLDGLGDVAGVPEPHLAVIPAAGQVVLLVGVEVQVPHQLAVGVLDTVDLAGGGHTGKRRDMRSTAPHSPSQTPASMGSGLGLLLAGRACDPADRGWLAALKGATWHPDEREPEGGDCHGGAHMAHVRKDHRDRKCVEKDMVLTLSGAAETEQEGEAGEATETLRETLPVTARAVPHPYTQPGCRLSSGRG